MERLLHAMAPLSPVGLALIACVAFGLALAAREALGVERGLRAAAERARDAAIKTLTTHKDWELREIERYRRLLGCHIDAIVAEATEFRDRLVPSPGGILESLCSWNADWKRDLARSAGLRSEEVERLLKNELPITPGLARRLERFTGAPARYWEYLWRLHDEYRTETDETLLLLVDQATRARRHSARVPAPGFAPAPVVVGREPAPSAPAEIPAPAAAHPELVLSSQRGALPPPPRPRSPRLTASRPEPRPARAALDAGRADRPLQRQDTLPEIGDAWDDLDRTPLNATLPGVGGQRPPR